MREQFEKFTGVKERLSQGGVYWDGNKYMPKPLMNNFVSTAIFLNGAWYAFQEQQKRIETVFQKMDDMGMVDTVQILEDYILIDD